MQFSHRALFQIFHKKPRLLLKSRTRYMILKHLSMMKWKAKPLLVLFYLSKSIKPSQKIKTFEANSSKRPKRKDNSSTDPSFQTSNVMLPTLKSLTNFDLLEMFPSHPSYQQKNLNSNLN